ncbi:MAG: glycosyltransferase family 4 protein [Chloroflexi bacterium]|nr:glycosyltransferase family 4 protein [Chloroflexota bacterium]
MSSSRKHLLMLSDQDVLRAGNQVLFETIRGYVEAGWYVSFVTNQKDDPNVATAQELFGPLAERVRFHRFTIPFHQVRQRIIGRGWAKRWSRLRRGAKPNPEPEQTARLAGFPPPPEQIVPFLTNTAGSTSLWSRLNQRLFERAAFKTATHIAQARPVDLVYGFEVMATPMARELADRFHAPLCTRFQGSFLKPSLDTGAAERDYPLHLRGTRVPADLCVMSNDGTHGEEVLLRLGHLQERIMFAVDGIRKDIYAPHVDKAQVWGEVGIPHTASSRVILTLSKLGIWKRHDRIIGAMPAILRESPDTYLAIAHRGEMRPLLEEYARKLGVAQRVVFVGPVPHTQVYRLLNACDVYVNCNDHSNLSHPVMEAMVCGKAVVSIDDGSLDGIITDGENGVLVGLPNIRAELSAKVIRLLKDDAFRSTIGENARRFSETGLYSWEQRMKLEVERVGRLARPGAAQKVGR